MSVVSADPPAVQVPAGGGNSNHQLVNSGGSRLAFKVKSSNNSEYRLRPVFGFIEAGGSSSLEITRLAGPPKEDKLVIQFVEVPAESADVQEAFKASSVAGEVVLPMKAE